MSHPTDTWPPASPVDAAMETYLAPVPEHMSAMTAARSMARLLVHHPDLAMLEHLSWVPRHDGRLNIVVEVMHRDGAVLMQRFAAALGMKLDPLHTVSSRFGEVVSLGIAGFYDGTEWDVWTQVSEKSYAESLAQDPAVAA